MVLSLSFFLKFRFGLIILVWTIILSQEFEDSIQNLSDLFCYYWEMSFHSVLACGSDFSFLSGWFLDLFFLWEFLVFKCIWRRFLFLIYTVCVHCTSFISGFLPFITSGKYSSIFFSNNTSSPLSLFFPLRLHFNIIPPHISLTLSYAQFLWSVWCFLGNFFTSNFQFNKSLHYLCLFKSSTGFLISVAKFFISKKSTSFFFKNSRIWYIVSDSFLKIVFNSTFYFHNDFILFYSPLITPISKVSRSLLIAVSGDFHQW